MSDNRFDDEKYIDAIKSTIDKRATPSQVAHFIMRARASGLDPLANQIHLVLRRIRDSDGYTASVQTGIDGYRSIADRTGDYAGSDDYRFDGGLSEFESMQQHTHEPNTILHSDRFYHPMSATVIVWKMVHGVRCAFSASASWAAYYPGDGRIGQMWRKMPYLMLGKCAEALALRKAFPQQLSGLYTYDEMQQGQDSVEASPITDADIELRINSVTGSRELAQLIFMHSDVNLGFTSIDGLYAFFKELYTVYDDMTIISNAQSAMSEILFDCAKRFASIIADDVSTKEALETVKKLFKEFVDEQTEQNDQEK